ncbi:MAG: DUF4230 domain-containing protein [Terriglobia bacterium]
MPNTNQSPRRTNSLLFWVLGILAGVVLTIVLAGTAVRLATGTGLLQLMAILRGGRTQINVDQPTVVRQIQQLQRLETVSYTMDKIISGGTDNPYLPKLLVGDRLLLLVHGEVIAGVNLAKVQPGDVAVRGRDISIRLPPAEVFSTRVDNAQTRVYSRDTGLFSSADPDQNARNTVSSMLQGLGFNQVTTQ